MPATRRAALPRPAVPGTPTGAARSALPDVARAAVPGGAMAAPGGALAVPQGGTLAAALRATPAR